MQPNKHMNRNIQRVDGIFYALIKHFPPSIDENSFLECMQSPIFHVNRGIKSEF